MFTGIITDLGTVVSLSSRAATLSSRAKPRDLVAGKNSGVRLTIRAPKTAQRLRLGSSVAINGVCTTVEERSPLSSRASSPREDPPLEERDLAATFTVRLMPVTLKLTTLGSLKPGDRVNLEPSLKVGDELGGHFVMGHVDGVGIINKIQKITNYQLLITSPGALTRFIVARGSLAVDGVSLTVVARRANVCTVSLVDYTMKHTTLGALREGDRVNIEIDPLARYAKH